MKRLFTTMAGLALIINLQAQKPEDPKTLIYHERFNSAEAALHQAIGLRPADGQSWYWLGLSYLGQDKVKELMDTLRKAPAEVSEQPLIKSLYGYILLNQNKAAEATQYFDMALNESKMKDPAVLAAIASAEIENKTGNAAYALELLQKAIKKDKDNPALYTLMGDAYRKLADGGNAYRSYQQALEKDHQYAAAEYKIGKIFVSQNNPESYLPAFTRAVTADPLYAPALYELYYYYYFKDIKQANQYLEQYIAASDRSLKNEYIYTDMLYATGKFDSAIQKSEALIKSQGEAVQPRLYKLAAYSYQAKQDTIKAKDYMLSYFRLQHDTDLIAKDFEAMGDIYTALAGKEDSAAYWFARGADLEKDTAARLVYYTKISSLYKKIKDYNQEATWLGKYYNAKPNASNVDLFNWGLAHFLGKDYAAAATVFKMYEDKYPKEEYGYYWSARSNAAIDTAMESGLAVPHYQQLVDLLEKDSSGNASVKKHLVEAYGYIAAYKANTEKDYPAAIGYFEKLLSKDPENADATRYVNILKKNMAKSNGSETSKAVKETPKTDK
jgi:tetratricopeptide (TPR) repeat protein